MCGISGMVGLEDRNLLKKMGKVIRHRGPDDSGIYVDKNVGLINQRLSIIDIKRGHQPIHNEERTIWVTYNGEIYNYLELKKELEKKKHKFYTASDTEVLVHLYEEYGDLFVKRLRGMFAFAIWDRKKKKLLLGRDRLGIKPLYYTINNGNLLFGSEIKSILQHEEVERKVDFQALHDFLTLQYVPGPRTMFQKIKKLQPGYILIFEKGKVKTKKYWDVEINPSEKDEKLIVNYLINLLKESVKIRLMSEVPLGVFLSGGLDSSTVTGIMSMLVDEPVKTYTVGFDQPTDEFKYAKIVADHFDTDHHELTVKGNEVKILPEIIWHFDEPLADPAALPTYLMSKVTKKHATVVLVGEGGDETFAGYPKYRFMLLAKKYKWLLPKSLAPMSSFLSKISLNSTKKYLEFLSEFISVFENDGEAYKKMSALGFHEKDKKELYSEKLKMKKFKENPINTFLKNKRIDIFKRMVLFDMKVWLCDRLLMKVDKMTMASSIEARVPLLDHKLVEFMNTVPTNLKLNKYIFKKSMVNILPKEILKRKKHGFAVPITKWFEGELKEIALEILSKLHKEEYFKYTYIQKLLKNPRRFRHNQQLWNLLNFEIWHKIYIDGNNLSKPKLSIDKLLT